MENPNTWSDLEVVIEQAKRDSEEAQKNGVIGLSSTRVIADALRKSGLVKKIEFKDYRIVIGDWSKSRHQISDAVIVSLQGVGVSDEETVASSYNKAVAKTGCDPQTFFEEFEDRGILIDTIKHLQENFGYKPVALKTGGAVSDDFSYNIITMMSSEGVQDNYGEPVDSGICYDALDLLLWFFGFGIENFSYKRVDTELPLLMGGFNSILGNAGNKGFGYGLYSS